MMELTPQATDILFRFLNLFLLLCILGYMVINKVLPGLREQFMQYRVYIEQLWNSHRTLQKNVRALKREMGNDAELQDRLKKQVLQWQSVVRSEHDTLLRERDMRKQGLLSFFEAHQEQIALRRMYKRLIPEAILHARKQLEKQFASEIEQQKFIKKVMNNLRS